MQRSFSASLLAAFPFSVFRLVIQPIETLNLPPHKGSAIRGAFGHAFRSAVCVLRHQDCARCMLLSQCVYAYVFESIPPADLPFIRSMTHAPHPFVLRPPIEDRRFYEPGEPLSFDLILMGKAMEYLPYYAHAFVEMGRRGLGKGRGKFVLETIQAVGLDGAPLTIFDGEVLRNRSIRITLEDLLSDRSPPARCSFRFISPVCIREKGAYLKEIPGFGTLFRNLLRRIVTLAHLHAQIDCAGMDFSVLCHAADEVVAVSSGSEYIGWRRYSNRKQSRMPLAGFTGEATYEGDFAPFWPFMVLGEYLHIGKHTSFGLGRYRLEDFGASLGKGSDPGGRHEDEDLRQKERTTPDV